MESTTGLYMELEDINSLIKDTLVSHLGIEITSVSHTEVEASMPVDNRTIQPFKILHGGASLTLGETLAAIGSLNLCKPDEACYGAQVSANHVSSAKIGDSIRAKASIIHKGNSLHVWDIAVYSVGTGKLISTIRVTNSIIKK